MAEKSAEIECMTWRTVALILAAVGVAEALVVSSVTPTLVAGRHTRCVMNDGGGGGKLFRRRELESGAIWEGRVSEITHFGAFVRMGHEQHMGLIHVSTLFTERVEPEEAAEAIEEAVGPVGALVRVLVKSTQYRGAPRVSLTLLEVLNRQSREEFLDDVVLKRSEPRGEGA